MKKIKAYQCNFCSFYRKTKSAVKKHEKRCFYNPKNRACATCKHNRIYHETFFDESYDKTPISPEYIISTNWCEKKNIELNNKTLCAHCDLWEEKGEEIF